MFYTYLTLMFLAFILSLAVWEKIDKRLAPIVLILLLGIITELIVKWLDSRHQSHNFIYHIYIPVEYTLYALFFLTKTKRKKIRPFLLYSIPFFIVTSIILSVFFYDFSKFPSLNFNIEGFFVIIWAVWMINSFDEFEEVSIFHKPVFWLCVGLIVFFAGLFVLNTYYNYLKDTNEALAKKLNEYINNGLNSFLYITMSISFLCSLKLKKY